MHADRQRLRAPSSLPARWIVAAAALALASGCSVLEEDKVDYRSAKQGNTLEVPPDLSQLSRDNRYTVPGSTVTASGYQTAQPALSSTMAANQMADVRIERAGNQRWLVVNRPPEQLWPAVRDFWQENGFLLVQDQQALGILETDWAENRAKLPQDFIRSSIGKLFDSLYSTGERDKFRTRLERTTAGGTEIYVSHRGMIEVYTSTQKDNTVWQPRPADPELETEFLRRLMVKLGVGAEQAKAAAARPAQSLTTRMETVNNRPTLVINEDFDRAWRRVGLALDRTGFTVEDRDRAQGTYFVRYVAPDAPKGKEPGFFGRLFGSSGTAAPEPLRYRVLVRDGGTSSTTVSVLNNAGQPESSANAQRIVQVLADDMK